MSAIYGAIALDGQQVDSLIGERFHEGYCKCKIDKYDIKYRSDAVMGCEVQFFTKESREEVLPIIDEENHLFFTADCILDYRDDLMLKLGISDREIPDGKLLYKAYLKWGKSVMDYVRGMFSFVAYNWQTGEVHLQTDHFSSRCLFYQVENGVLYFSTLFFPLINGTELSYEQNERWLVDAISLRSPAIITEPEETAVLGVKKIVSGTYVLVNRDSSIKKVQYYNPEKKVKINKKLTDEECEKKIRELMKKSVEQCIRTDGEVGVMLSAGLDSSTVACIASPMLEAHGKRLYGYTSIPVKEAELPSKGYRMYDETAGVMKICEAYPNIIPHFIDCPEKSILTEAETIVEEWELPCKSEQNAVWVREIKIAAKEQGCKVMLSGATGNCTISAGNFSYYIRDLLLHGRFIKAYRDIGFFMNKYGGRRNQYINNYIKAHLDFLLWYFRRGDKDIYENCITKRDIGEKYNTQKRFNNELLHVKPLKSRRTMNCECYMPNANAQIGEIDTKSSLYRGVLDRDPMRNVDLVEFCMSLPLKCFNNAEYDRRLVREFMHDIVPEEIRLDVRHRGYQSGDNEYRIERDWKQYSKDVEKLLKNELICRYIEEKRKEDYIKSLSKGDFKQQLLTTRMVIDSYIFSYFLQKMNIKGRIE